MKNMNSPPYGDSPWLIDLHSHGLIIGMTGTGKSNYLRLILDQLNREDCNTVLLDPHGEVTDYALMKSSKNRVFLTILGYTMASIIAARCSIPYDRVMNTISGIREVVYSNGSHSHVEYTKEQRELLEKLKIDL